MFGLLLLFALLLSLADAAFLVVVAGEIGALPTVGLVVLTALLGSLLVRSEGRATLRRLQQRMQEMERPTDELLDGALILVGDALPAPGRAQAVGRRALRPAEDGRGDVHRPVRRGRWRVRRVRGRWLVRFRRP
jgi:hypothetical protein